MTGGAGSKLCRSRRQPMTAPVTENTKPKLHKKTINALRAAGWAESIGKLNVCRAV